MKILSNFDTRFDDDCVDEACAEYGKDNISFIRRDRIYIIFKIVFPTIGRLTISLVLVILAYGSGLGRALWYFFQVFIRLIVCITWLYLLVKVTIKLIDFYMDFTIITPRQITSYDQSGLFSRNTRSLDIDKIKSVRVYEQWIIRSLFNYGTIVFFSEWDDQSGDITLNYISNPTKVAKRLEEILQTWNQIVNKNK